MYGYNINVNIVAVFCDLYKKIIWKRNLYVCCVVCILHETPRLKLLEVVVGREHSRVWKL